MINWLENDTRYRVTPEMTPAWPHGWDRGDWLWLQHRVWGKCSRLGGSGVPSISRPKPLVYGFRLFAVHGLSLRAAGKQQAGRALDTSPSSTPPGAVLSRQSILSATSRAQGVTKPLRDTGSTQGMVPGPSLSSQVFPSPPLTPVGMGADAGHLVPLLFLELGQIPMLLSVPSQGDMQVPVW